MNKKLLKGKIMNIKRIIVLVLISEAPVFFALRGRL